MNRDTRENLACKSISKKKQRTAVDVEDVRWEVAIMSSLPEHPNIVKLRAAYEDSEAVHLVMELCVTVKTKPVFVKVNELKPGTKGHNLTVKVVSSTTVLDKKSIRNSGNTRIAECLIGDDTASILFTARNDQVELMKPGATVIIRNAKIDMFKGSMRLAVDKWGRIEVTEPVKFEVKEDNNLSLVEYELVNVVEE